MTTEIIMILISSALSATALIVGFLVRWVLGTFVKRLEALETTSHETTKSLHVNDVETVRQQGRISVVEANHGELDRNMRDLKAAIAGGFRDVNARLDALAARGGVRGEESARGQWGGPYGPSAPGESSPRTETPKR